VCIAGGAGYPRPVSTAHEPNQYGYAGEGTTPEPQSEDLEDTAENIAVPFDDLMAPAAEAADETEDQQ
jgi:hypothetical protein